MTTLRYSRMAFVGVLFVLSASSVSAMSCAIDKNGKTTCPTSEQVDELRPASEPVACTMDAKQCPDGSYVGRVAPHCEFAACPGADSCAPYKCVDGTEVARCAADGTVINYFAEPCLTHGGDAGPFKDVSANHPNAQAIAYVKAEGIVEGYADGTFKPDQTINRAEFVKILIEAAIAKHPNPENYRSQVDRCPHNAGFYDVNDGHWFRKYVCRALDDHYIDGYPDKTFRPGNDINFAEAAKIIANALIGRVPVSVPWYKDAVLYLELKRAIPLSIVSFDQKITRAEMAEIIWRAMVDNPDIPTGSYWNLQSDSDASMKLYKKPTDSFDIHVTYPAEWLVQDDAWFAVDGTDADAKGVIFSERPVADGALDGVNHVRIAILPSCPDLSSRRFTERGTNLVIQGNYWSYAGGTSGAAGSTQEYTVYTLSWGGRECVVVTSNTFLSTGDAYDEPMRSQVKAENAKKKAIVRAIVDSIIVRPDYSR